jgi:hypothetical protein
MTLPPSGLPGYPWLVSLVTGLADLDGQPVVQEAQARWGRVSGLSALGCWAP